MPPKVLAVSREELERRRDDILAAMQALAEGGMLPADADPDAETELEEIDYLLAG